MVEGGYFVLHTSQYFLHDCKQSIHHAMDNLVKQWEVILIQRPQERNAARGTLLLVSESRPGSGACGP